MSEGQLIIKPFRVTVRGYNDAGLFYARSRGKALADAWRCDAFNETTFAEFLKVSRCQKAEPGEMFGMPITVAGRPAFFVTSNRQYVQFVRADSDVVLSAHPLDVEPNDARRGTPYFEEPAALNPTPERTNDEQG